MSPFLHRRFGVYHVGRHIGCHYNKSPGASGQQHRDDDDDDVLHALLQPAAHQSASPLLNYDKHGGLLRVLASVSFCSGIVFVSAKVCWLRGVFNVITCSKTCVLLRVLDSKSN